MEHARGQQEGFALAVAVLALVIVGAIVTGGFYAASQEGRAGMNSRLSELAFHTAERGIHDVVGEKNVQFYHDTLTIGQDTLLPVVTVDLGGIETEYEVRVVRMATRLFYFESTGRVTGAGRYTGERQVGMVARTPYFYIPRDRALETQGPLRIRGNSLVTGKDTVPAGWNNCPAVPDDTVQGIVAKDSSRIDVPPGLQGNSVEGDPPIAEDATLDSADFLYYGDMSFEDLAAMAEKVYGAGASVTGIQPDVSGSTCITVTQSNWGEPYGGTCDEYFPIIYGEGDLSIQNDRGQGILVVNGDLSITGNFEFAGIVLVKGNISVTGTGGDGAKLIGTVKVFGGDASSPNEVGKAGGSAHIQMSSCAVEKAYRYNVRLSRAFPIPDRSWVDLSAIGAGGT